MAESLNGVNQGVTTFSGVNIKTATDVRNEMEKRLHESSIHDPENGLTSDIDQKEWTEMNYVLNTCKTSNDPEVQKMAAKYDNYLQAMRNRTIEKDYSAAVAARPGEIADVKQQLKASYQKEIKSLQNDNKLFSFLSKHKFTDEDLKNRGALKDELRNLTEFAPLPRQSGNYEVSYSTVLEFNGKGGVDNIDKEI